jgi:hypothetical protein
VIFINKTSFKTIIQESEFDLLLDSQELERLKFKLGNCNFKVDWVSEKNVSEYASGTLFSVQLTDQVNVIFKVQGLENARKVNMIIDSINWGKQPQN